MPGIEDVFRVSSAGVAGDVAALALKEARSGRHRARKWSLRLSMGILAMLVREQLAMPPNTKVPSCLEIMAMWILLTRAGELSHRPWTHILSPRLMCRAGAEWGGITAEVGSGVGGQ